MYNPKSLKAEEFISDEEIRETLAYADANKDNVELIDQILAKAKECKGLTHERLLCCWRVRCRTRSRKCMILRQRLKKNFTETGSCFCTVVSVQLLYQRLCILSVS